MNPNTIVRQLVCRFRRSCVALSVVLASVVSSSSQQPGGYTPSPGQAQPLRQQIHAVYLIDRQPMGTYDESAETLDTGDTRSVINSDLVFNRMGSRLEMKSRSQYEETKEAQLTFAAADISSSQQTIRVEALRIDRALHIQTTTGGKSYARTVPISEVLLGPEGARRLILSRCHAVGDSVTYTTFFPELGSVVTVTDALVGMEDVATDQGKISALKIEQTLSAMPGRITLWLDRNAWLVRQTMPGPFGDIEAIRNSTTTPTQVQGAVLPQETFGRSIVKGNIRLPQERFVEAIRLKIIQKQPELGWPSLVAENQRVIEKSRDYMILDVYRPRPGAAKILPIRKDEAMAAYLSPNALLQSDDPDIQAIAKRVVGNERDAWKAARALQLWTNEHMQFDPGIAIAPASEVARNRRGTCFGYSMLLGALTRAAGIPSRLRMGYVYAGGIWGGHAWIDVRVGKDWIPLDGALYTPGPADAARFSFFTSALEEGTLAGVGSLGQLLGHADIKILKYTVAGKQVEVPDDAAPFVIEENMYRNPWLGLSIVKPSGFRFAESDLVWPQTTVIAMEGPRGEKLEIADLSASVPTSDFDPEQRLRSEGIEGARFKLRVGGRRGFAVSSERRAGTILIDHGSVWMIGATGPDARTLLEQLSSTVRLRH